MVKRIAQFVQAGAGGPAFRVLCEGPVARVRERFCELTWVQKSLHKQMRPCSVFSCRAAALPSQPALAFSRRSAIIAANVRKQHEFRGKLRSGKADLVRTPARLVVEPFSTLCTAGKGSGGHRVGMDSERSRATSEPRRGENILVPRLARKKALANPSTCSGQAQGHPSNRVTISSKFPPCRQFSVQQEQSDLIMELSHVTTREFCVLPLDI
jgi:hypothetical protein